MKFHQLKISNFGSIGDMVLPLEGQGLTLLLGRNEDAPLADSNGAGKSLPLDAFTWCLWGSTVRGVSSDEVIHNKKNKDCSVELTFSDGDKQYKVIRYRKNTLDQSHKPNDLILMSGDEEVSGSSVAATQEMITDILGLDFTTFCAMMPGAGINVASMTDAEVKGLLEKLLRTQALSKASDEARKRLRALSDEQLTKNTMLKDAENALVGINERVEDLSEKENTFSYNREEKLSALRTKLEELTGRRATMMESLQRELQIEEDLAKYIQGELEAKKAVEKAQDLSMQADVQFRDKMSAIDRELVICDTKIRNLEDQEKEILGLEGSCPTCKQGVTEKHTRTIVRAIQANISNLSTSRDGITFSKSQLKKEWDKSKENRKDILTQLNEKLDKAGELVTLARMKKHEMRDISLKLEVVEEGITNTENSIAELESDANPFEQLLSSAEVELSTKQSEKEELLKALSQLSEDISIMKFWVDSFSPQGLRSFLLENVTPILNSYAKTYSDLITDGEMEVTFSTKDELKSGKTKEKFNIKVSQKHGGSSYASNSSGERARANLIIALALGELAAMRADKVIPFRFLDEPFESIDETGTEAIVNLLNQMRDKYNTVYVITHQDYLKQLFSNKFTVVKQNGFSTLEK